MNTHDLTKVFFSVLLSLSGTCCFATDTKAPVTVSDATPGVEFSASVLYLRPGAENLGWGVITNFLPLTTPTWEVQTLKPRHHTGFNLGAQYACPNTGSDLALNWSHLRTLDHMHVAVNPSTQPTVQWVSPFSQTGTAPVNGNVTGISQLKSANASVRFHYDALNFEIANHVDFGCNMNMRFFTGLSGVRIKETLLFTFKGQPNPVLSFDNTARYKGIGPRLGVCNTYDLCYGLNFISQLAGALFVGHARPAQYKFAGSSDALALVGIPVNREYVSSKRERQLVPAIDAKLGLNYVHCLAQGDLLTLEFGYMAALYVNPLSTYETNTNVIALDSGSLSTSSVKHTRSNFSASGLYLNGKWAF
jgi:hypothetical protein